MSAGLVMYVNVIPPRTNSPRTIAVTPIDTAKSCFLDKAAPSNSRGHLTIAAASGPRLSRAICQTAGRSPGPGNDLQTGLPRLHRRTGCGRYADCPSRLALGKFLASYRESVLCQCERSVTGKLKVSRKLATIKQVRGAGRLEGHA